MSKTAVVLFNLGGPDSPDAVEPFLFNLFNDKAIIGAPGPIRWLLARFISKRRGPTAREIYAHLGGASPLLPNSQAQAEALEKSLNAGEGDEVFGCFLAMRYWHPMAEETARAVKAFGADRVVLLPLYPQFSTTTSGSSLADWQKAAKRVGLTAPSAAICCYPKAAGWIEAVAERIHESLAQVEGPYRLLFSAHGLPKKIVAGGDPYQWQVEQTAKAVVDLLRRQGRVADELDWGVCYQSRVGPLEWIGPATEDEIARAGSDRLALVLCPIAFVSEHSETLVELDIEYAALADENGVLGYHRVPTVDCQMPFIEALAALVRQAPTTAGSLATEGGSAQPICPGSCSRCPLRERGAS